MKPSKLAAAVALAAAQNVTHFIESGRFGGMSTLVYAHHGQEAPWRSIPSSHPPDIALRDGNAFDTFPQVMAELPAGARVAVVFDGPKREMAYGSIGG
eukprot:gene5559-115_t